MLDDPDHHDDEGARRTADLSARSPRAEIEIP